MKGGKYCFRIGQAIPGGWLTTLKMVVSPAVGDIAHITALEKGFQAVNPPRSYVTPLTGSATIASQVSNRINLQISLSGSNDGADDTPGERGIWIVNHAIRLRRISLAGHDQGYKTFNPIKRPIG